MKLLSVLTFLTVLYDVYCQNIGATVTLDYGTFIGSVEGNIIAFRGIPFADPPLGQLRWRAPVIPPTKALGTVNATNFGLTCIPTAQIIVQNGTSEDCLLGNVWVPSGATRQSNLSVLVYFHGGGFQGGNSREAIPDKLFRSTKTPFIFATFQYRLGQFGFLGGPRVKADGDLNAGLLDQRGALRWVQRYIRQFGGDNTKVTIWGQSAGAGSTMYMLLGNGGNNEGLFRAAMGDSPPSIYMPHYSDQYVVDIFHQFASFSGCQDNSNVMHCLRNTDTITLTDAGNRTIAERASTLYVFAPMFDEAFLLDRPGRGFQKGNFAKVPVLFGSNTNDGFGWSVRIPDPAANTSMPGSTQRTVYNFFQGQYNSLTDSSFSKAVKLYPLKEFNGSYALQTQVMYGDVRFVCTAAMITAEAATFGLPSYHFHYDNPINGSTHGAEKLAFFSLNPVSDPSAEALLETMRQYWTSFITSGKPVALGSTWKTVSNPKGGQRLLLHPGNVKMEDVVDPLAKRCAFWRSMNGEIDT